MVPSIFVGRPLSDGDLRRFVRSAEEGGAASLMVGDHVNWYSGTYECLTLVAYVAAQTTLRIGTNVVVLPLRQPFLLAKMAATLAQLTGGRFVLGVGVGGEHEVEFSGAGIPVSERGARSDEGLSLIRSLLAGGDVDLDGRFVRAERAHLDPNPGFPILVGGRSEPALRRAARYADGWSSAWVRSDQFGGMRERITATIRDEGRDPDGFEWVAHARVTLAETPEAAWDEARDYLASYYNADPGPFRRHTIAGPPEVAAETIGGYFDAGADEVLVTFSARDALAQQERFLAEVMPLLESA